MRLIICLAFIWFGSVSIFAQATVNAESNFLAALDKANKLNLFLHSSPYRTIQTGEITLNSKEEKVERKLSSYKTILETDSNTGKHVIYEVSKNSVRENYEAIYFGGKNKKLFERNSDGNWKQVEKFSITVGGNLALPTSREYKKNQEESGKNQTILDYRYLGKEEINNQITDVYTTVEKRTETSSKKITTKTNKFWFSQDGKILRMDWEIIIETDAGFSRSHYVQTWQTDENIKIEPPMLSVAQ